jgi:hypothetical protein
MEELRAAIKNLIADLPLPEAVRKINLALPSNTDFIGLKARTNRLERKLFDGLISPTDYDIEISRQTRSVFYFIDRLEEADLNKVFQIITGKTPGVSDSKAALLFITATPQDQEQLQTGFEYAAIQQAIASSPHRDNLQLLAPVLALNFDSLLQGIGNNQPDILHFSGHAGKKGLILSDEHNNAEVLSREIIHDIFESFGKTFQCVFLNACYSSEQAKVISRYAEYVIGMNLPIGDKTAIMFSEAFYRSLCNEPSFNYEKAFKQAKIKLKHKIQEESTIPEIWIAGEKAAF